MTTQTQYETGATSPAVNNLVLFTDNTRELAALRDDIYKACADGTISPYNCHWQFYYDLFSLAVKRYKAETKSHIKLNDKQRSEFSKLYFIELDAWKKENGF
jgi:hypothetical protein